MCESPRVLFCMLPPPFLNLPLIYSVHISMKSSSQKSEELSVLTLGDSVFSSRVGGWLWGWVQGAGASLSFSARTWQSPGEGTSSTGSLGVSLSFPEISQQKLFYGCPEQDGTGSGSGRSGMELALIQKRDESKTPRTPESENVVHFYKQLSSF